MREDGDYFLQGFAQLPQDIGLFPSRIPDIVGFTFVVFDREIKLKRESGVRPELPRSGKQERTLP
jgi:hypothetical protein